MPRAPKHCGSPGCPELVTGRSYCPAHERRDSNTARGYGRAHKQRRAADLAALRDGVDVCWRCERPMWRTQVLQEDHNARRDGYRGLTHRACNEARLLPPSWRERPL
jgi:hypothetical protein